MDSSQVTSINKTEAVTWDDYISMTHKYGVGYMDRHIDSRRGGYHISLTNLKRLLNMSVGDSDDPMSISSPSLSDSDC